METTYKWFQTSEIVNLDPMLVEMLDKARDLAMTPFKINSGYRTPEHNLTVGGEPNSAHIRGLAVDLACTNDTKRSMMLKGLLDCGTPVFIEIAQAHIHVDIDSSIHAMNMIIISNDN